MYVDSSSPKIVNYLGNSNFNYLHFGGILFSNFSFCLQNKKDKGILILEELENGEPHFTGQCSNSTHTPFLQYFTHTYILVLAVIY